MSIKVMIGVSFIIIGIIIFIVGTRQEGKA